MDHVIGQSDLVRSWAGQFADGQQLSESSSLTGFPYVQYVESFVGNTNLLFLFKIFLVSLCKQFVKNIVSFAPNSFNSAGDTNSSKLKSIEALQSNVFAETAFYKYISIQCMKT